MQHFITVFPSAQATKNGKVQGFNNFEILAEQFVCTKGEKAGPGFVRGELDPPERNDKNATQSTLLIIDGDEGKGGRGAPDPKDVHEALVALDINHIIYTSHSHDRSEKKYKYRVIIESERYVKSQLDNENKRILNALSGQHINIKYVKEMKAWSQIWYAPRSVDPEIFEKYTHLTGNIWRVSDEQEAFEAEEAQEPEEDSQEGAADTLAEMYAQIRNGKNVWPNLRDLAYKRAKDGVPRAEIIADCENLLHTSHMRIERPKDWETRMKDIPRMVEGGFKRVAEGDDIGEVKALVETELSVTSPPPKPHGLLGKFVDQTKEFMLYEDDTIAFVSSMFILSSICGRKFNVDIHNAEGLAKPTALNMYFTLAAETGVGKSEIEDAVENCYTQFAGATGAIQDFFYKGRVSGPRALYRVYKENKSIGIIANEAGIEGQSTLGDSAGLRGAWLNLYGQGAWKKWTGASELSDADNSIKSLRAIAISRVSESTPVELSKYYRLGASVENGLIPRENIFVIKELNEVPNMNIRLKYDADIVDRMTKLVSKCHADIKEETLFKPFIITVEDSELLAEIVAKQRHYRHLQNKGSTIHERAMSGRMFVKMLRYAGLITAFNKTSDDPMSLVLERLEWEWAVSVVEDEYSKINDVVALTSGNDVMDALVEFFSMKINSIITDTTKSQEARITPEERKLGVFPPTCLRKIVRSNPMIKDIEGDPRYSNQYKSGFDKVIDYMIKMGYLEKLDKNPTKRGTALKVLPELLEHWSNK